MGLVSIRKTAKPQLQSAPRAYTRAYRELVAGLERVVPHILPMIRAHAHPGSIAYRFGMGLEAHNDAHDVWQRFRLGLAAAYVESMELAGAEEYKKLGLHRRFVVTKADKPKNGWHAQEDRTGVPQHRIYRDGKWVASVSPNSAKPGNPTQEWSVYGQRGASWGQQFVGSLEDAKKLAERKLSDLGLLEAPRVSIGVPINPYSVSWIRQQGADKLRHSSEEQRELVRGIVASSYELNLHPEQIAEDLKRVIGLTPRQAAAVENRRQQALDETNDQKWADGVADDYAEKQLAYRVETIARTENAEAREQGRQDSWLIARDEGDLPQNTKRRWVPFPSGPRLCDACAELGDHEPVGLDESFTSDDYGEVDVPPLHPDCRCTVVLEFE